MTILHESTFAKEGLKSRIPLVLHQPQPCSLLVSPGHVPTKCSHVFPLRAVLAVVIGLPEAFQIHPIQVSFILPAIVDMQRRIEPLQALPQTSSTIAAFQESLKVSTLEEFPMDYAITQNNLGTAYRTLAEVEDKAGNSKKAIQACEKALKVHTLEQFPMDYAEAQTTLGSAYKTLAQAENKTENCRRAGQAFQRAIDVWVKLNSPENIKLVEEKLSELKMICN